MSSFASKATRLAILVFVLPTVSVLTGPQIIAQQNQLPEIGRNVSLDALRLILARRTDLPHVSSEELVLDFDVIAELQERYSEQLPDWLGVISLR